jgi:DNA invertase Pin-like site-specific DNA recombinase
MSGRPAVCARRVREDFVSESVDRQTRMCREYVLSHWGEEYAQHQDSGLSREGRDKMLLAIEAGQHDVLVVWHVDRLSRDTADLLALAERLRAARCALHTVASGPVTLDAPDATRTASG